MIASKIFGYFHLGRESSASTNPAPWRFILAGTPIAQALMSHDLNTIATVVVTNLPGPAARPIDCPMRGGYSLPDGDYSPDRVFRALIEVPCTDGEEST